MNKTLDTIVESSIGKGIITGVTLYVWQETLHVLDYTFEPHQIYSGLVAGAVTVVDYATKLYDRYLREINQWKK